MPMEIMTPEEAEELRRELYGDPDGGSRMVISSGLARDMKRYHDKRKAEEKAQARAEAESSDAGDSSGSDAGTDQ